MSKRALRLKETFVKRSVSEDFTRRGYIVFEDNFKFCHVKPDVAAFSWRGPEEVEAIAIECKGYTRRTPDVSSCIRAALGQAALYRLGFPRVYVAVPKGEVNSAERIVLRGHGIGLLLVDEHGGVHEEIEAHEEVPLSPEIHRTVICKSLPALVLSAIPGLRKLRWSSSHDYCGWCAENTPVQYGLYFDPELRHIDPRVEEHLCFGVKVEYKSGFLNKNGSLKTYLSSRFDIQRFWECLERTRVLLKSTIGVSDLGMLVRRFEQNRTVKKLLESVSTSNLKSPGDVKSAIDALRECLLSGAAGDKSPGEILIYAPIWNVRKGLNKNLMVKRVMQAIEAFSPIYEYLSDLLR